MNSQGHSHLYSHAVCKGVGMCEGVSVDTLFVCIYIGRYTPHWKYSVYISMCIGICPCISLSFCLQFKKNLKVVLFKRRAIASKQSIIFFQYVLYIIIRHMYLPVSSVIKSSGQHVLFPARKILRWTSSSRRKSISLSTWALQLSMISREFMRGHQSPLGLLCTMRFIIVILGW